MKQNDAPRGGAHAQVAAARGECESFQIVIRAPAGNPLTHTNVTISALVGSGRREISARNIVLYREHYVSVSWASSDWGKSNRPLGPGLYPDALIPFVDPLTHTAPAGGTLPSAPFTVPASRNQPVWVDIVVPRQAVAGDYSGTFSVTSDQGNVSGQVSLRVWNFTLPVKPSLRSAFLIWQPDQTAIAGTLLDNKISPLLTSPETARGLLKDGLHLAGLPFWSGADVSHCVMQQPPAVEAVRAAMARMPKGVDLLNYTADEIGDCKDLYPMLRQWGAVLHKAGAKNLVTIAPTTELLDDGTGTGRSAVDIWAVLAKLYVANADAVMRAIAKGDAVWSYTTLVQDGYSPKWEIDFAPINFRIQPGFLSYSLGLTGILYWRVDLWSSNPWVTADTKGQFNSDNFPGEGMLVYPGGTAGIHGVAPSVRLKWIRDGIEDYEYTLLLDHLGYGAWAHQMVTGVAADWSKWTQNPDLLDTVRRELGEKLDSLAPDEAEPGRAATARRRKHQ